MVLTSANSATLYRNRNESPLSAVVFNSQQLCEKQHLLLIDSAAYAASKFESAIDQDSRNFDDSTLSERTNRQKTHTVFMPNLTDYATKKQPT